MSYKKIVNDTNDFYAKIEEAKHKHQIYLYYLLVPVHHHGVGIAIV